jgi:hypothetical protein
MAPDSLGTPRCLPLWYNDVVARRACHDATGSAALAGAASSASPGLLRSAMVTTVFILRGDPFRGKLKARLAEATRRRRSPYFAARSLALRFLAMNAIRMRWEMLRACIF